MFTGTKAYQFPLKIWRASGLKKAAVVVLDRCNDIAISFASLRGDFSCERREIKIYTAR